MHLLLSILAFLLLSANSSYSNDKAESHAAIKLGALLPLSGQYAAVGVDCQHGIEIAQSEISSSAQFEFVTADSKADATTSVSEFRKLLNVDGVIGVFAFRGPVGMAVNPLSKSAQLPLLGGVGNKDFARNNEYAFQLWPRSDVEGEYLAHEWNKRGLKKVGVLTVQDDWPVAVSMGLRERGRALGFNFVFDQDVLPAETDFRSQVVHLRNAAPDVIFINVGLNQIAPLLKQVRELGVRAEIFSNFWLGKKDVLTAAGSTSEGVKFVEMTTSFPALTEAVKKRFNSTPSGATLSSYVATHMFAQALSSADSKTPHSLHARLTAITEIQTPSGVFSVKNRFVQFPLSVRIVRDGRVEALVQVSDYKE